MKFVNFLDGFLLASFDTGDASRKTGRISA